MIQVEKNQHTIAEYTYDGDGRRISKTEWIESLQEYQTIIYVYAGSQVIYEKNLNTNQDGVHVYGPLGRIAKKVDGLIDYYHADHLGSTRLTTDESGNTITEVNYSPFGEETVTGEENSYLYTGKEKDVTGLYYYGARYYNPEVGRFITRDPLQGKMRSPQTQNRYTYCLNNPLKYVDPQGLDLQYVILPDGTVSRELASLYNSMQKALNSLTEEDWEDIENFLASNDVTEKMKALKMILKAAGIDFTELDGGKSLSITLGESKFTIEFRHFGVGKWGEITEGRFGYTINISDRIFSGGDLFLTLGHELAHAFMIGYHGDTLRSIEQRFTEHGLDVYMEFISYEWQSIVLNQVPHVSLMQRETIKDQFSRFSLLWYSLLVRGHTPEM